MDTGLKNVDGYIRSCPKELQENLQLFRETIKQAAPLAQETIKYGMPTYVQDGNLVHFAACKNHFGFYPAPSAIINFSNELTTFAQSKGSIHFPIDKPLPLELISKIVRFRVAENAEKASLKKLRRKKQKA